MNDLGSFIISGFNGIEFNRELEHKILIDKIGGLIFFSRNIASLPQVKNLINNCRKARASISETPLIIAVDHEGAPVHRFGSLIDEIPSQAAVAKSGMKYHAVSLWQSAAKKLSSLGFNVNFAPVLDIGGWEKFSAIGIRSFGCEKETAADFGAEFIEAMKRGSISCFAKHFPGLGKTGVDSHSSLPVISTGRDRLLAEDISVFGSLIRRGCIDGILLAHALYPHLDRKFPASMSRKIISGLLYEKLNFRGITITDDIDMMAIRKNYEIPYFAEKSVEAGSHFILACHNKTAIQKIFAGLSRIRPGIIENRLSDISRWKKTVLAGNKAQSPAVGRSSGSYAGDIAKKALTIKIKSKIKRKNYIFLCFIPQPNRDNQDILRIKKMLKTRIKEIFSPAKILFYPAKPEYKDLKKRIPIIITCNIYRDKEILRSVLALIKKVEKNCYCMAIGNPHDMDYFKSCAATGCTYSPDSHSVCGLLTILKEQGDEK